jgi:nitrite reductase (NADH) small subunit
VSVTEPAAPDRLRAGTVADFHLNRFRTFEQGGRSIGVVRTSDGFYAILNRCPHMAAPLCVGYDAARTTAPAGPFQYRLEEAYYVVRCPSHRWEFRLDTGESVAGVTKGRLIQYPVIVEGRDVYVELKPIKRASVDTGRSA